MINQDLQLLAFIWKVKPLFGFKHYVLVMVFLLGMNFLELFKQDFRKSGRNNRR
jgi:hypothetical protein